MTNNSAGQPLISVNSERLKRYFVRLFAGLGILNIWGVLLIVSASALVYGFSWISSLDGFVYVASLLLIPLGVLCLWVCFFLSIEFLSEIGIEINGAARFFLIPVAIPLVVFSFVFSIWISAGEAIRNKGILIASFIFGLLIMLGLVVVII